MSYAHVRRHVLLAPDHFSALSLALYHAYDARRNRVLVAQKYEIPQPIKAAVYPQGYEPACGLIIDETAFWLDDGSIQECLRRMSEAAQAGAR